MIKLKAFIYRFSNIFGLYIYLANKEEQAYIRSLRDTDEFNEGIYRGVWQGKHGFTTVFTYRMSFRKAIIAKVKHAFDFRSRE